jgi:hypothetical protein
MLSWKITLRGGLISAEYKQLRALRTQHNLPLNERVGLNSTADAETLSVQGQGAIEEALLCCEDIRALRVFRRITWCQPD